MAAEIDDAVRALAREAIESLSFAQLDCRFELLEKLHITIAFLGSVPESDLPPMIAALRAASAACSPFTLTFQRMGAFPSERRPRILWLGLQEQSSQFDACAHLVRSDFEKLGFQFDKEATAHITICRLRSPKPVALPQLRRRVTLDVRGLTLFQSLPAGPTTRYEALDRTAFSA